MKRITSLSTLKGFLVGDSHAWGKNISFHLYIFILQEWKGWIGFVLNLKYRPRVIIWCLGLGVNSCALWLRQTKDRLFFNVHCVLSGLACIVLVTVKMISVDVTNKDLGFLLHNQLLFSKFFIRKYQSFKTKIKLWHIWGMSWNSTLFI